MMTIRAFELTERKLPQGAAHGREAAQLVVCDLRKSFAWARGAGRRVQVLRGVSIRAAAGEMVAIVGASGAGKSTLLHVLGGIEAADAGSARLNYFEITQASAAELTRFRQRNVGFIFQFHHLLPDLTTLENVALPLLIARAPRRESLTRAREALGSVGLADRAFDSVTKLSGGEQQRVAIARALVNRPSLILADEPTGNLDARTGDATGALLASLCRTHQSIVIVATHNEQLVRRCHCAWRLRDGKLEAA